MTTQDLLLKNVFVPKGIPGFSAASYAGVKDLHIKDGCIRAWGENLAVPGADQHDCTGMLVLPGLVDGHVHLDKTLWGEKWTPSRLPAMPTLSDLIQNERAMRAETKHDPRVCAPRLLEQMTRMGTVALRSHIDIDPTTRLDGVAALLEVRNDFRDRMHIELVAFPQSGILQAFKEGTDVEKLLDEALAMGVDAIGGLDPAAFDRDAVKHLDIVFGLAAKHGAKVDIHLHEPGSLGAFSIKEIAKRTGEYGLQGKVTLSHAFALGHALGEAFDELLDLLDENRISVVTNVPGGTEFAPHVSLLDRGVNYALGSDNIRDCWLSLGNGDMLDRVRMLALRRKLRHDSTIERAFGMATFEGAHLLGLEKYGLTPGCRADLVLVKASCIAEAVANCPTDRRVVKNGKFLN